MDRQAITRHLLSDAQDPYNRKPLTVEMLVPNNALRTEIEEWIRQVVSTGPLREEFVSHATSDRSIRDSSEHEARFAAALLLCRLSSSGPRVFRRGGSVSVQDFLPALGIARLSIASL